MSRMGQLIVNKVTYNSIFVTWKNVSEDGYSESIDSSPFGLIMDRHLINFSLSIDGKSLSVIRHGSGIGRGIVFLGIAKEGTGPTMKAYLNEQWKRLFAFDDIEIDLAYTRTVLTIDCKVTWLGFIKDIPNPEHPLPLLSIEDVPFDNTIAPDFTIIAEGQEIPSHKAILARYSPVFSTMFRTPMKESEENKVTIEDIEYSTMKTLLKIIYTGKTDDLKEIDTALKVFQAAAKYEMSAIKILCEYKLQLKIQVDNVLMLLVEADKYEASLLCETCIAYIYAAQKDKITEEFKKISQNPDTALAVMNKFRDQLFLIPSERSARNFLSL